MKNTAAFLILLSFFLPAMAGVAMAQQEGRLREWIQTRQDRTANKDAMAQTPDGVTGQTYGGREILVHVPENMPPSGKRALVIVLHGGMGSAVQIHSVLDMAAVADRDGFVVAYLNGEQASPRLGEKFHAWNAGGGCCGQPFKNNVDDVVYIQGAVDFLAQKYGIDKFRVYGIGHSNGAMMVSRLICESDVLAAGIPVAGPLQMDGPCPAAAGKKILAIHGADDSNVPLAGGAGSKGVTNIPYKSEAASQKIFTAAGADFTLDVVAGTDHNLGRINKAIEAKEGINLPEKAAALFGLSQ